MHSSSTWPVIIFIFSLLFVLPTSICQSSPCSEEFALLIKKKNIKFCKKLATLGAEFAWNYYDRINNETRIDIFFRVQLPSDSATGWLAWGVNPSSSPQMVGTRALIGIKLPDGSLNVSTYNITADTKLGFSLLPSQIDVTVISKYIEYMSSKDYYGISATLVLPSVYNISKLNHVWQVGPASNGMEPLMHSTNLQNVDSTETIDLRNQKSVTIGKNRRHLRMVHGILNILGWGTFLPIGVMVARYCRVHPKKLKGWFQLHVSCQIVGYILGTAGWIIGLLLGHASTYYRFRTHRILAICIFSFTTLQILALRLKPRRMDEYRRFWDMYHHFLGYSLLALISVNIFKGIGILKPDQVIWKWTYISLLGIFALISLALEIYSWIKFLADKKKKTNPTSTKN